MKQCPFCSEEIQDAAVVCRHCGRDIAPQSTTETATTNDRTGGHQERMYVVGESHYQEAIRSVLFNNGRHFFAIVKPEPANRYDRNAIRICSPTNETIGYLPREVAARYKGQFDSGLTTVPASITGGKDGKELLGVVLSWNNRSTEGSSEGAVDQGKSSASISVGVTSREEAEFEVEGSTVDESEIRELVKSEKFGIEATVNWYTPAGNRRSAPIYEAEVENEYLNKRRTVKAKSTDEFETKLRQIVETWAEQEIRNELLTVNAMQKNRLKPRRNALTRKRRTL